MQLLVASLLGLGALIGVIQRSITFPQSVQAGVIQDDLQAVWLLTQLGQPVDTPHPQRLGQTPLFEAQSARMVSLLVARGADVNARTPIGATPLHLAIRHNRVEVVRQLLALGADVEAQVGAGGLPIHFAAYEGDPQIVRLLVRRGSPLQVRDGYGLTPLLITQRLGHEEATQILKQALGQP